MVLIHHAAVVASTCSLPDMEVLLKEVRGCNVVQSTAKEVYICDLLPRMKAVQGLKKMDG